MKSIEYYESLAKHEGLRKTIKASKCYTKLYRRDYLDKNTENGYYYQLRILQYKCLGLHFDEVFSLYKKQIINLNKKDFLHYFSYGRFKFKNNILTHKPRKTNKKPIVYANGNWIEVEIKSQKPIESFPYYYRYNKKFKTERIYTGDILTFESLNDPKYKRCQAELLQKRKKNKKLIIKAFNEKSYSFISKKEIQLKEEKRLNKEKLYSHGFDDESFKGPHYRRKKEKKLKMNKIPIAEEYFSSKVFNKTPEQVSIIMIEFAKIHVEAALKKASESKSTYVKYDLEGNKTHPTGLNKQSILNAYPLDNIK